MFTSSKFEQSDPQKVFDLIARYPLATLVTHSEQGINGEPIPLILQDSENDRLLQGHIAKASPMWQTVADSSNVLAIFNGPNCYISPNYYPSKVENGKAVPTWNYVQVQATGTISFTHDKTWVYGLLERLTKQLEAQQTTPWSLTDAPETYIERMLSAVVGIEITIDSLVGKWKTSQNQSFKNRTGVIQSLSQSNNSNSREMAKLVGEYSSDT